MVDITSLENAEFKEAFDEFDKVKVKMVEIQWL